MLHDENGVLNDRQVDFDREMLRRESNLHQFVPKIRLYLKHIETLKKKSYD